MKKTLFLALLLSGFSTIGYSQNDSSPTTSTTSSTSSTSTTTDSAGKELDSSTIQQQRQQSPSSGAIRNRTGTQSGMHESETEATRQGRRADSTLPSTSSGDTRSTSDTTGAGTTSGTVGNSPTYGNRMDTTNKKLSAQDTELIRSIRSQISADQNLSTRAKNITVLSDNGKVILKGAVANSQEKAKVEEIAKKATGTKSVENLTEVGTY